MELRFLTSARPRLTFAWGYSERRLLRARARGDGTGRKRDAKTNWRSVCLRAGSHGNGLSCVPHANTGVHSNMSDVSVQATVSFIITFTPSRPRGCHAAAPRNSSAARSNAFTLAAFAGSRDAAVWTG